MRLLICSVLLLLTAALPAQRRVLLDADTANEVDDPFALLRLLVDDSVSVTALNGTQWQVSHYNDHPNSALASHRLNQSFLGYLDRADVPTFLGGANRMYDWGDLAQHSAAAYEIIRQAEAVPPGEKLTVVALGALTNVASAIYIAPATAQKIELYWLGTTYDFDDKIMRKRDFNCVMDVQALEVVLNSEVDLYVLPVSEAKVLRFTYGEVAERLPASHPVTGFLLRLWQDHRDGGRLERTLWDIGIVELLLHPDLATAERVPAPAANGGRMLTYFRDIDVVKMKAAYWEAILEGL